MATEEDALYRLEHVLDVGRERRERIDHFPELARRDLVLHRESENMDQILAGMPDYMGTENMVGGLVHDHLGPSGRLGIRPR